MTGEADQPDDQAVFNEIYLEHYPALNRYAYTLVKDGDIAEDMVHNVFLKFLENHTDLAALAQLKAYLYRSIYNECMNYLKHQNVKLSYVQEARPVDETHMETGGNSVQHKELKQAITNALNDLPEQCRTVFQLSRFEELRYKEIALQLGISVNTVEKHMVKALKRLRIQLEDYLPLLVFYLLLMHQK